MRYQTPTRRPAQPIRQRSLPNPSPNPAANTSTSTSANQFPNPSPAASSTPPIISINGANPAHINIGDTYNDLGATITGPTQADTNLGIETFLNGALVSDIIIDTTQPATDTLDYVASNAAGTSTSTRTIYVLPAQAGEAPPAPEPGTSELTPALQ